MSHEDNIKKIDKMSHKDLIRNSHQYKDYLERHPKTKEILGKKEKVAKKMSKKDSDFHPRRKELPWNKY